MSTETREEALVRIMDELQVGRTTASFVYDMVSTARADARKAALEECWRIAMNPVFTDQPPEERAVPMEIARRIRALADKEQA
jgi:hypothetical protein